MPDDQFTFLKNELNSIKLDVQSLHARLSSIHQHLKVCQTRCHVPGPEKSIRAASWDLVNRIIDRLL